jgi:FAD/FMN-containing dehydrogenase
MDHPAFCNSLAAIVGSANALTAPADMAPYLTDWRDRYEGKAWAVARPGDTTQVAAVMRLCQDFKVNVVPQGGNTGLCGAATPDNGRNLVLRLDRMNRIRDFDDVDAVLTVEAGCVLATIQEEAATRGYLFPMSLGAEGSCQIGGNIATNAGGTAVLRYGPMRDLVLGLEVVLADGSICDWLTPLRKNTTGYDLRQLFVGAEGTLGVITAACLKVFPSPVQRESAMVALADVEAALALLKHLRGQIGERLLSFEIMNKAQVDIVLEHMPGITWPMAQPTPWCVLIEVTDTLRSYDLRATLEALLGEALEAGIIDDAVLPASHQQQEALWRLRHNVSEANKRAGYGVSHDTAVPLRHQASFARRVAEGVERDFPDAQLLMVGHIGDGNIHAVIMLDPERYAAPGALNAAAAAINTLVDEATLSLGGTISAEHGIGQTNKARLIRGRGAADIRRMQAVKRALDPDGRMNPGKVFDLGAD